MKRHWIPPIYKQVASALLYLATNVELSEHKEKYSFMKSKLKSVGFDKLEYQEFTARPLFAEGDQVLDGVSDKRVTMMLSNAPERIDLVTLGSRGETSTREEIDYPGRSIIR